MADLKTYLGISDTDIKSVSGLPANDTKTILGSKLSRFFKITVDTTKAGSAEDTFVLPLDGSSTYNFDVNWGDGSTETVTQNTNVTHQYAVSGEYQISISGTFPHIFFTDAGDKLKLISIDNWGATQWQSMHKSFYGCSNMVGNYKDKPDLSGVTDMSYMFTGCASFNKSINNFDTSTVKNMRSLFYGCTPFNQPVSNLNTSKVTNMFGMFYGCSSFNQSVSNFDTSKVTDMRLMFFGCTSFKQDISGFSITSVTEGLALLLSDCDINLIDTTLNYDNLLISLKNQAELYNKTALTFAGGNSKHSQTGQVARDLLTLPVVEGGYGWTITDGGLYATFNKAKFVFTTDDGLANNYDYMYPLYEAKGIKGTFHVPSDWFGQSGRITWAEAIEMHNNGHLIQAHAKNHERLTELTESELNTLFTTVDADFVAGGLPEPAHLAYPHGANDALVRSVAANYYNTGRTVAPGYNVLSEDLFQLKAVRLDMTLNNSLRLQEIKDAIDDAVAYNWAIIFDGHGALPDENMTSSTTYTIQLSYLEEIIDYIQTKDADIITTEQLYQLMI